MKPEKLQQTTQDDGTVRLDATFSTEDVDKAVEMAQRMIAYNLQIRPTPGFDIQAAIVEQAGQEQADQMLTGAVASVFIPWLIDGLDFQTIMAPEEIELPLPKPGAPYSFSVAVTPKPEYELDSYEPLTITLPPLDVSEQELDARLAQVADSASTYEQILEDRGVQDGDHILFALKTDRHGDPIPNLTADKRIYDVGEGWFSEDFDKNLIGMKAGESKTFDFEAKGLNINNEEEVDTLTTTVTVHQIQTRVIPAITDAWVAKSPTKANTVEEFKDLIREQMIEERKVQAEQMKLYYAGVGLAERLHIKISDELYEFTQGQLVQELQGQAQQQGMTLQQMLQSQGMNEQQLGTMLMLQARSVITQGFALDAYFRHFDLEITDEDINATLQEMSGGQMRPEMAREQYEQTGRMYAVREGARRFKASKKAVEQANVVFAEMPQQ